jgi:hypothetical protein
MNEEEMVLDGPEGQEGGSADVMERKERYLMRFLKGMVTDRNTTPSLEFCFHAKLTIGSEAEFISPINESLIFIWVVVNVFQPSGMVGRWIVVRVWICPLDDSVGLCPEKTEEEGMITRSSSEISGCCIKAFQCGFGIPSIFQHFEDVCEVTFFCSLTGWYCRFWHSVFRFDNDSAPVV